MGRSEEGRGGEGVGWAVVVFTLCRTCPGIHNCCSSDISFPYTLKFCTHTFLTLPGVVCPAPLSVTRDDYLNTFDFLDKLADGLRTKMAT